MQHPRQCLASRREQALWRPRIEARRPQGTSWPCQKRARAAASQAAWRPGARKKVAQAPLINFGPRPAQLNLIISCVSADQLTRFRNRATPFAPTPQASAHQLGAHACCSFGCRLVRSDGRRTAPPVAAARGPAGVGADQARGCVPRALSVCGEGCCQCH